MRERLLVRDSTCSNISDSFELELFRTLSNSFERGASLQERPKIHMHLRDHP